MDIIIYGNEEEANDVDEIIKTAKNIIPLLSSSDKLNIKFIIYAPNDIVKTRKLITDLESIENSYFIKSNEEVHISHEIVLRPEYIIENTPDLDAGPSIYVETIGLTYLVDRVETDRVLFVRIGDTFGVDLDEVVNEQNDTYYDNTYYRELSMDLELSGNIVDTITLKDAIKRNRYHGYLTDGALKLLLLTYRNKFKLKKHIEIYNWRFHKVFLPNVLEMQEVLINNITSENLVDSTDFINTYRRDIGDYRD